MAPWLKLPAWKVGDRGFDRSVKIAPCTVSVDILIMVADL